MLKPMWKPPTECRTLLNTTGMVCPWNLLCRLELFLLSGPLLRLVLLLMCGRSSMLMLLVPVLLTICPVTLLTHVFPQLLTGALLLRVVVMSDPVKWPTRLLRLPKQHLCIIPVLPVLSMWVTELLMVV